MVAAASGIDLPLDHRRELALSSIWATLAVAATSATSTRLVAWLMIVCVSHLGRRATLKAFPVPSCAEGSAAGSRLGLCVAGDQVTHMRASADQQNIVSMAVEEEHETCVCLLADVSA